MNLDEFLAEAHRLRKLRIEDVGHPRVREWWSEFVRAPETFLVKCSPPVQAAIWAAVERRRKADERGCLGDDLLDERRPQASRYLLEVDKIPAPLTERRRVAGTTTASEE